MASALDASGKESEVTRGPRGRRVTRVFTRLLKRNACSSRYRSLVLHRQPNALEHEPRGLLRDAEAPRNLMAADAVLGVGDDPDARQSLIQTKRRVLKDGAGLERELPLGVAGLALPTVPRRIEIDRLTPALGAADAVRPAARNQVVAAVYRVGEVLNGVQQRLGHTHNAERMPMVLPRQVLLNPRANWTPRQTGRPASVI